MCLAILLHYGFLVTSHTHSSRLARVASLLPLLFLGRTITAMPKICFCCVGASRPNETLSARDDAATTWAIRLLLLGILTSMGICLPPATKLPNDTLFMRVFKAIYASQRLAGIACIFDLDSVESWNRKVCLTQCMNRHFLQGKEHDNNSEYTDPFNSVRSFITAGIAQDYEHGEAGFYRIKGYQQPSVLKLKVRGSTLLLPLLLFFCRCPAER